MHTYHMTRISWNSKTGPIPVITSSRSTCPTSCPLKENGCYSEYGPMKLHWDKVSEGKRGGTLEELCAQIKSLPEHQLWRYGQAGDLPGDGVRIDFEGLLQLVSANKGRKGFGYTHYDPTLPGNARAVHIANTEGFTINLSANSLEHADELVDLGVGPVVVILPADATSSTCTPKGRMVAICPASAGANITCATCAICAHPTRKAIIGFPAHGTGKKKAQMVFFTRKLESSPPINLPNEGTYESSRPAQREGRIGQDHHQPESRHSRG